MQTSFFCVAEERLKYIDSRSITIYFTIVNQPIIQQNAIIGHKGNLQIRIKTIHAIGRVLPSYEKQE